MLRVSQSTAAVPSRVVPESPAARRLRLARWRDPRLWVGLVLVAASVLVGARLLAAADDTVAVWALGRDVGAGTPLMRDALVVRRVRFADPEVAAGYVPAAEPVPRHAVLTRDGVAGELLVRAAVGVRDGTAFELPVVVSAAGAPEDLRVGETVDVWVAPPAGSGSRRPATQVLTAVPVLGASRSTGPLGDAATRQVLLGLDEHLADGLGPMLGQMSSGSVVLVRHGAAR